MHRIKKGLMTVLRFTPLALCLCLMTAYLLSGEEISVDRLKAFAPNAPLLSAGFLLTLYAFKSLTIVFPIIVLNVLGGFLFPTEQALFLNLVGVLIELSIPYWVGRLSGAELLTKMEAKSPQLAKIIDKKTAGQFFPAFFLRVIFCLPGDLVSVYFGAMRIPFWRYLAASFLGMLPGTVAATLLGVSITDPASPLFWISAVLTVGISVLSLFIHSLWKKRHNKKTYH